MILEPRRRIDQALYAVVMEAYVAGVSTRAVDDVVAALGIDSGISKSEVSRICAGLDEVVTAFRTRRLDHTQFPCVFVDATYLHVRNTTSQVVSMAVVVATGVTATGGREVLGLDVGDSEDEVFWRAFLKDLKARGLSGVRLVISDQHTGLVSALRRSFQGVAHQRCRVHFARNLLALVPKTHTDMVATEPAAAKQLNGVGQSGVSRIASDQHQPASSRAIATLAMVCRLRRSVKVTQRWWSRGCPRRRGSWRPRVPGPRYRSCMHVEPNTRNAR